MFRRLSAVCAVLACFVLLLSSCSHGAAGTTAPTFTGFSCKDDIAYRDMKVKGRLSRVSAGTLTLEIEEPSTLSGMKLSWDGEQVRVNMLGLSVELDPADIPASALGSALVDTLDTALRVQDQAVFSDGVMKLDGECAAGSYTVTSDPATGALLTVAVPDLELRASFADFTAET